MQLMFVVAAVITIFFAVIFCGSIIIGLIMSFIRPLRIAAPFVLFIPSLASLGAVIGSWGLGYIANYYYPVSILPFWAWIFGLFTGAALGLFFGLLSTLITKRLVRLFKRQPA
jgi:hypothetical protein